MKIIYGKEVTSKDEVAINSIANSCDILFDTARLLYCRGIDTVEKARAFLCSGKSGFNNPFLLSGMYQAVDIITNAKKFNQNVLIFGDYDADGVSAVSVLYYCLLEFGIEADIFVPEREDGYGLNLDVITRLDQNKKIDLLITVDCGISDREKIEEIKKLGIEVIVTDHHEPPQKLPDCVRINPKISGQRYPFYELCGAGVAYKLGYALIGDKADKCLDLVALATVADSMDLVGENRDIVVQGLKLFNDKKNLRAPFKYLLSNTDKQITAQTLAYAVAPRVNAGGRMGDANCALKLFTSKDENQIFDLAVKLSEYNVKRQEECDRIYREAKKKIEKEKLYRNAVILVVDEGWGTGFIGIVAAKLVEEYCKPTIVFAGYEDYYKGSCRSVEGFNVHDALTSIKHLLIAYGGHAQAAGVSVSKENFEQLNSALNEYATSLDLSIDGEQKIYAEWEVDKPFSMRFARELDMLEPFGVGNRRPLFVTNVGAVQSMPLKSGSPHFSFKSKVIELLDFNGEKNVLPLSFNVNKKVVFELNLSVYKNRESLKGYVRKVIAEYGNYDAVLPEVFCCEIQKLNNDVQINPNIVDRKSAFYDKRKTIYALSNPQNLAKYPELNKLPVCFFNAENLGGEVVISPENISEEVERVVYLDKPLSYANYLGQSYIIEDAEDNFYIKKLSVDREEFARIFNLLCQQNCKRFISPVSFIQNNLPNEDFYQATFCLETFLELNIFSIKNGIFGYNQNVKNALTNSKVYSKIYTLKV